MIALAQSAFVVILLATTSAHAQTIYRCTGADGKISFSDSPCPGQKSPTPIKRENKPLALSPAERRTISKNMGESEKTVTELEAQCAKGFRDICKALDQYKTKTFPELLEEDLSRARKACALGDRQSCEALSVGERLEKERLERLAESRKRLIERYSAECAAGDRRACKNLSDLR